MLHVNTIIKYPPLKMYNAQYVPHKIQLQLTHLDITCYDMPIPIFCQNKKPTPNNHPSLFVISWYLSNGE